MDRVGVIGLGLMGGALADRFRAGGRHVVGFDPREECRRRLAEIGGEPLESDDNSSVIRAFDEGGKG